MQIVYRSYSEYSPVDIGRLRPGGAYDKMIAKRTYGTDHLLKKYGCIPAEMLSSRPCPTCGSNEFRQELSKDNLELVRCNSCDLVYVNPIFNDSYYAEIYQAVEYQEIVRDLGQSSHEYRRDRFGGERTGLMSAYLDQDKPRYLDIGCSTGFVVEAAQQRGWQAMGIDLNPEAIAFGQARGLDLRNCALEEVAFPPESFDAVSLFDVLEHMPDPDKILRLALNLLKPSGVIYIYVPNYDSASRFLQGADAHFIWPTHHLNYYNPHTILDLFRRHDLTVEYMVTEGLDIEDYIWYQEAVHGADTGAIKRIAEQLQFFINAGAYGKNLRVLGRKGG